MHHLSDLFGIQFNNHDALLSVEITFSAAASSSWWASKYSLRIARRTLLMGRFRSFARRYS
jgi:hypothetical protein